MASASKLFCDEEALEEKPLINVDYLSHVWREEDIWVTRRFVLREKSALKNSIRLENALWRTWTQCQQQLNIVPSDRVDWAKDSDITWLYGPWKSSGRSPTAHAAPQRSYESSQPPPTKRPSLKRALSFVSYITVAAHSPMNDSFVSGEGGSKTSGDKAWIRLSCASAVRYREWPTRTQFLSTNRKKVHFDPEVQQCIAIDSTMTLFATYDYESSPLQGARSDDATRVPGAYYSSMESCLVREKDNVQTIAQLQPTGLKSPPTSGPCRGGADSTSTEDISLF
ncbi:uncharacterized protein N7498_008964 [Penicillium cinerascens]|uniref:Nitrogen regulatory protein areA GATA-like domain-containing protein n=1 Tax=Penicillium cinerascens TaxID=70096 RepID=A0A9W9JJN7_9EURO|nr:uncharacterized protein N7498_008964 [Penicillium cinerascens]KAJ5195526.1 hypothetical protein N7498_008964 [Penicillium cinerascens]